MTARKQPHQQGYNVEKYMHVKTTVEGENSQTQRHTTRSIIRSRGKSCRIHLHLPIHQYSLIMIGANKLCGGGY